MKKKDKHGSSDSETKKKRGIIVPVKPKRTAVRGAV